MLIFFFSGQQLSVSPYTVNEIILGADLVLLYIAHPHSNCFAYPCTAVPLSIFLFFFPNHARRRY